MIGVLGKHETSGGTDRETFEMVQQKPIESEIAVRSQFYSEKHPRKPHVWKATPTSVKKTSTFFPVKLSSAVSLTLIRKSHTRRQGSVLIRAKAMSSFFGLKSSFFCFAKSIVSHETIAVR